MWLLLVLQLYLHQIINLNTNVLKVLKVSLQLLYKKPKFLTHLSPSPCIHTKMIHFEKRKIKYTTIFTLEK